ncbi:unnamed protein product, partial [Prorocentrum cordatum]
RAPRPRCGGAARREDALPALGGRRGRGQGRAARVRAGPPGGGAAPGEALGLATEHPSCRRACASDGLAPAQGRPRGREV